MHLSGLAKAVDIRARAVAAWRPPEQVPLSAWIERYIVLPGDVSAMPGRVRLTGYQKAVADALTDPDLERVVLQKSARLGFSTLLTSFVLYVAKEDPAPVILMLPREADCRDVVVSDLLPVAEASGLDGLLSEDEHTTMLSRRFPGGSLKVIPARSPRALRRHTAKILLVDECDGMEVTPEGSPLLLAEKRTLSFPDRKIIIGSTPVDQDTSHVARAFEASDQRVFEIECPHCRDWFELQWEHIHWPPGEPEKAVAHCQGCGCEIPERLKNGLVERGRFRALRPEVKGCAGFRVSALVSPLANAAWGKLAAEYEAVKNDPAMLRTFWNTVLGRPWQSEGEAADEAALQARAEAFSLDALPEAVLYLTCGVDVQRDRLEASILGHGRDGTAYVLAHHVLWGMTDRSEVWGELDTILKTRWPHPLGGTLGLDAVGIDAGDGATMDLVCRFAAARVGRRVLAVKGVAGFSRQLLVKSKAKVPGGTLWLAGVDALKTQVFDRLQRGTSIRFSNTLEAVFYEQLASERRVVRMVGGQPKARFERIPGRRAEALDTVVYALAARSVLAMNWTSRSEELKGAPAPKPAPRVIRSRWMGG